MMDIHTVAAGGGSICQFRDGRFQVGPESAAANPGPASYQRGGPLTVTDCNVMPGTLNPDHFPAVFGPQGNEKLDVEAVRLRFAALANEVAAAAGEAPRAPEEMARGFLCIAVDNMANPINKISIQRGHDVTGYTRQCFGGAGGQHACLVADALGMRQVFIHPFAGVLSAFGMGLAKIRALREVQFDAPLTDLVAATHALARLAAEARAEVQAQGLSDVRSAALAHLRYDGSHQPLPVPFGDAEVLQRSFEAAHHARFGFISPGRAIWFEMLSCAAIGSAGVMPDISLPLGAAQPVAEVAVAYMGHVQANAGECVRRVIDRLNEGKMTYPMDEGHVIRVKVSADRLERSATVDFTGTGPQHKGNYNAPSPSAGPSCCMFSAPWPARTSL